MKIKPIAIFPRRLANVPRHCGPHLRGGRKRTQVACRVEQRGDASFAVPLFLPDEHVEPPTFRLQLRVARFPFTEPRRVGVVLQPALASKTMDPEQRILQPLCIEEPWVLFEFTRGDVLTVTSDGQHNLRFAAIDSMSGRVGTEEREVTELYSKLIERCLRELAGGLPLFPPKSPSRRSPIPGGQAVLSFGEPPVPEDTIEPLFEDLGLS